MNERAELVSGSVNIETKIGEGTNVTLNIQFETYIGE